MKEFIMAALPWVIAGLCVAVLAVQACRKESKENGTYMMEGMCIGMCLGVSLQSVIGFDNSGTAMCIGMLIGEVIGMMIPKKKDNKEENDNEKKA